MDGDVENTLAEALGKRWNEYRAQFKTCRREFAEEAVHDLRVAARRLSAVLDILRAIHPHPGLQKMRRFLKGQLDNLDDLRDAQVMLVETSETQESLPQLETFREYLQKQEKRLLQATRKQVQASRPSDWNRRIEKMHTAIIKESNEPDFSARLLETMDKAYLKVAHLLGKLDRSKPATIHRLRIAFKKFRYMVASLSPEFTGLGKRELRALALYQLRMGILQDLEVMQRCLTGFVQEHKEMEPWLRPFGGRLRASRTRALRSFLKSADDLFNFRPPGRAGTKAAIAPDRAAA